MDKRQNLIKSWQNLVSKISSEYPAWFFTQLQEVMKYVYFEIEGIDVGTLEEHEGKFFGFDDCFDWVSDRAQLIKDLEIAVNIFTDMAGFQKMDPYECAKLVIANR